MDYSYRIANITVLCYGLERAGSYILLASFSLFFNFKYYLKAAEVRSIALLKLIMSCCSKPVDAVCWVRDGNYLYTHSECEGMYIWDYLSLGLQFTLCDLEIITCLSALWNLHRCIQTSSTGFQGLLPLKPLMACRWINLSSKRRR